MAATRAKSGFGTLVQRGDGGSPTETFTTVAEIVNVNGPERTLDIIDASHMESPNGRKEYIPAMLDVSEITCDMNFLPGDTSQANLQSDQDNRTLRNFRFILPGAGKRFEGAAYVMKIGAAMPYDGKMVSPVTLRPSGPWNLVNNP